MEPLRYADSVMSTGRPLVSEEEFLSLPESNQRIELIDGEVILSPSSTFRHQQVLLRIVHALQNWAADRAAPVTVAISALDVRFAPDRILQPDAMVFLEVIPSDIPMPIARIPEICIEVVSTDRTYDRVTKRYLYAEAGVQEYWIVDPANAGVVERRTAPTLSTLEVLETQLGTPLLPGFTLDLRAVFARAQQAKKLAPSP